MVSFTDSSSNTVYGAHTTNIAHVIQLILLAKESEKDPHDGSVKIPPLIIEEDRFGPKYNGGRIAIDLRGAWQGDAVTRAGDGRWWTSYSGCRGLFDGRTLTIKVGTTGTVLPCVRPFWPNNDYVPYPLLWQKGEDLCLRCARGEQYSEGSALFNDAGTLWTMRYYEYSDNVSTTDPNILRWWFATSPDMWQERALMRGEPLLPRYILWIRLTYKKHVWKTILSLSLRAGSLPLRMFRSVAKSSTRGIDPWRLPDGTPRFPLETSNRMFAALDAGNAFKTDITDVVNTVYMSPA